MSFPRSWLISEFPGEGQYKATLSREPMQESENFKYGVAIFRTHNYRTMMGFKAHRPKEAAGEFAQKVTLHESQQGTWELEPISCSQHGVDSWELQMTTNIGSDACTFMWLVVAVKGQDWFHAAWSVPCSEKDLHADEIAGMVRSLLVEQEWKVTK